MSRPRWEGSCVDHGRKQRTGQVPQEIARMTAAELLDSAVRLGSLSVESKRLLSSIYIDGISGKEAASRHQITAGSVRVRCSRAVKELQRNLPQLLAAA